MGKHSTKLSLYALALVFFPLLVAKAQTQVSGRVVSSTDGLPLPGVNVLIQNSTRGAATDIDGNYSLEIQPGDEILIFSFVGYFAQEVNIAGRSLINITMEPDFGELEEIVVVGYGTVRKSDLTGSVSSIQGEELVTVPAVNPMDALQGKVAGVQIANSSGAPGLEPPVIRIRGVGTSGDPSPIFVVDGVILNDISYLNSSDIESVEVLKDASALAIYGNRGANGVILITTKLGKPGQGTTVNVFSEYSLQVQQDRIDLLSGREFAEVTNVISPRTFNNLDAVPNTDWQDLIFETAPIQNHQVSVSGGSENNQYYFSLGYFNQQGTIPESAFERLTVKLNERFTPKPYLAIGTNLTVSPFRRDNTNTRAPVIAYRASPAVEPFDEDGNFNEVIGVGNILANFEFDTDNVTRGITTVGQLFAEGYFLDGFTFKTSLGTELLFEENEVFVPVFFVSAAQQNEVNRFEKNSFRRTSWMWENTLSYDKEIGVHRVNAVAGFTLQEVQNERLNLTARNLFREGEDFRYLGPGTLDPSTTDNSIRDVRDFFNQISYLGRVNYSYDNRYIATFTFRRDGSSKFLGGNRYGNFPAVAFGWNVINERFIAMPEIISNLKLRASWGIVGNDKIDYLAGFNTVGNDFNAVLGLNEQQFFGQSDSRFGNPDLEWEEVAQIDIGLEVGLFDDQLIAEFDYYRRDTDGILIGLPLPDYLGNGANVVFFNAGEVRNSGLEFNIQWRDQVGEVRYNAGVLGAFNDNETLFVSGVEGSDELLSPVVGNNVVTLTRAGLPIGAFFGYVVDGVFQNEDEIANNPSISGAEPGDLIFRDVNGDGQITGDDRTFIGSSIPDFTYGIDLGASYKNFSLDLLFQGQMGNDIYNIKETIRPAPFNYEQRVINYWRGEGTSTTEPRPTIGGNNFLPSTRFVQDGSFIRLRTITLAYDLPAVLLNKANFSAGRVYLRGTNVFTITDFTGYNPEVADGNPLLNGIDGLQRGTIPVASVYSLGLNLTF